MINLEDLYSEVPPTKLRNIDEKFCPAKTSPFWLWVADRFFTACLKIDFTHSVIKVLKTIREEIPIHRLLCLPLTQIGGTGLSDTISATDF